MNVGRWDLSNEEVWHSFRAFVDGLRLAGKPAVFIQAPVKRSLDQNSMIHALYGQIAAQVEDQSVVDITRECKLRYGVGILRASDEQFRQVYDKAIKHNLSYEEKLIAMDFLPVTSRMKKEQASEYIDTVIYEYSMMGISLIKPSEAEL